MIDVDLSAFEQELSQLVGGEIEAVIGFNTDYAIYVHEVLTAKHDSPTQAKYLEIPLREAAAEGLVQKSVMIQMRGVRSAADVKPAAVEGVKRAALKVLEDAQYLCPKKWGTLAASATFSGTDGIGSGKPAGSTGAGSPGRAKRGWSDAQRAKFNKTITARRGK